MSSQAFSSILVLRLSALGDVIHTLPAVASLRRQFPDVKIGWVVEGRASMLLEGNAVVDHLYIIDTHIPRGWRTFLPGTAAIWKQLLKLRREKYDIALDFQGLFKSAILAWISGAKRRIGLPPMSRREKWSALFINEEVSVSKNPGHIIELNNSLVHACHVDTSRWEFPFPNTQKQSIYIQNQLDRLNLEQFVVINPGAGWITKKWAPSNYARLSDRIWEELTLQSVFTWGPEEEPLVRQIETMVTQSGFFTFPTAFIDLIPLLERARLFVGGDTGPMQLAAALGVPVVAIFGATNPKRNGPFDGADTVVHRELFCSNCYLRKCPYNLECLDLSVDAVFEGVKERLDRSQSRQG